ncbi:MAG: flagellar hook-basal body complex protein [Acidobacteria bacterium]|nr:flagellar hook-basal body complex protein [Acidobacteriota bacterium]
MDTTTSILASGLRARAESLDIVANNLANTGTPAFKSELERYALYGSDEAAAANGGLEFTGLSPDLRKSWINFSQGLLEPTARPLDVALEGNAYFVTESPDGNLLTRNGSFQIGTDETNKLKRAAGVEVHQGWLEKSNIDPTTGSIQMVKISRQFEMLQKALQLHGEMGKRSTEEVGRV